MFKSKKKIFPLIVCGISLFLLIRKLTKLSKDDAVQ